MRAQREPGAPKDCDGAAGSLGTRAPPPLRVSPQPPQSSPLPGSGLRAAAGGPLRDSSAPWRPAPRPRGARARSGRRREPRVWNRRDGADAGGGGIPRVTQARRSGCGRDRPAGPQVCPTSRLQPGAWPEARTSRAWGRCPPGLPSGIPEGAGAEPPHSGDASGPGWPDPGPPPAAPHARPAPSPRGRPRRASPRARPRAARGWGPPPRPPRCPGGAPRVTRARAPRRARRPARPEGGALQRRHDGSAQRRGFNGPGAGGGRGEGRGARARGGPGSQRVEVVSAPAQLLRVVRRHEREVAEDVQIRLVPCLALGRFHLSHLRQA